jgi:quercetin dioxygenase-like cupin family protein
MEYDGNMTGGNSNHAVYGPQSPDLGAKNHYLTSFSFQLDNYCLLTAEMPAGVVVPLHSHSDRESFYVLSGEMTFYDSDSWRTLRQGDFVDVLSNTKHAWLNASESSAFLLVVTTVRMGVFLRRVSSTTEAEADPRASSKREEHFFKLVEEYGYWVGSPADNKAIGLSSDWHGTVDQ